MGELVYSCSELLASLPIFLKAAELRDYPKATLILSLAQQLHLLLEVLLSLSRQKPSAVLTPSTHQG